MAMQMKYDTGQMVYLMTDVEQLARMIVAITTYIDGSVMYHLVCGTEHTTHYEVEITEEKNILMGITEN